MSDDGPGNDQEISLTLGEETTRRVAPTCPYCRTAFAAGASKVACRACGTPHHIDCWRENGGCTTYGCARAPQRGPGGLPTTSVDNRVVREARQERRRAARAQGPLAPSQLLSRVQNSADAALTYAALGWLIPIIPSIVAVALAVEALTTMAREGEPLPGMRGRAIVALVVGIVTPFVWIAVYVLSCL